MADIYSALSYVDKPSKPPKRFKLLTIADVLQRQPAPWLIKGLLPRQGIAAIFGPSGCGKTFLAISLVGALSRGCEWFGYRVSKVPVVYIALEGIHGIGQRIKAYAAEIGAFGELRLIESDLNIVDLRDEAALVSAIAQAGLRDAVIVVDTLAQATAGMDENSGEDMSRAIAACKRIQEQTNGLLILIHHTGKDSTRGMRGHSSLIGALDAAIEVSGGLDGSPRQWIARKVKDGESGQVHSFALQRVPLGYDEDGDEISSCVIEPTTTEAFQAAANKTQKAILNALKEKAISMRRSDLVKHLDPYGYSKSAVYRSVKELLTSGQIVEGFDKISLPVIDA